MQPIARKTFQPLLIGVFIVAILAAIVIPIYLTRSGMSAGLANAPSGVSAGAAAKFICRITTMPANNLIDGTLLAENSDGSYSPTNRSISIQWNPQQGVVMGSNQDLHSGAIIQVSGQTDSSGTVHADQIVLLTGYVTVH